MVRKILFYEKIEFAHLHSFLSLRYFTQDEGKVIIGKVDSFYSTVLNETRKIWIYMPNGLDEKSTNRYPVVYLLGGPAHCYSVVGLIQQFSQVNGNTVCQEMIVVAIANTDRTRDLTPTHVKGDPPMWIATLLKHLEAAKNSSPS